MPLNKKHKHSTLLHILCSVLILVCASASAQIKNGVNIQASYYNHGQVNIGWELMQTIPEIEAVRIEIEPYRVEQAKQWIKEAHENGYQVIATYHNSDHLGTDDREELLNAADWWATYYETLSNSGPIIINLMNEWGSHNISPEDYSDAYNEAISIIRSFYSGSLIIDVPGFGQATKIAADAFQYFEDQSITYSIHVYTSAFNIEQNRWLTHDDLAYLDATGADCMVGEFCDTETGGADWCTIIDECYANGWPLFGWAWNGDGGDMNMIEPHWQDDPMAQTFSPTEFMTVIIDKLAGRSCYIQPDENCNDNLIGNICDDNNEYTVNDRYNEYCHCVGRYTEALQNNTNQVELLIYPNPVSTNQQLYLEFLRVDASGHLSIFNSMGQIIMTEPISQNQNRISLDTNQLQSGLYWVSFRTKEKVLISKSFVVH